MPKEMERDAGKFFKLNFACIYVEGWSELRFRWSVTTLRVEARVLLLHCKHVSRRFYWGSLCCYHGRKIRLVLSARTGEGKQRRGVRAAVRVSLQWRGVCTVTRDVAVLHRNVFWTASLWAAAKGLGDLLDWTRGLFFAVPVDSRSRPSIREVSQKVQWNDCESACQRREMVIVCLGYKLFSRKGESFLWVSQSLTVAKQSGERDLKKPKGRERTVSLRARSAQLGVTASSCTVASSWKTIRASAREEFTLLSSVAGVTIQYIPGWSCQ